MSGWATKPLGEICTFANGLWKGKKGPFTTAGVFRNTNFRPHGVLDDVDIAYLEVEQRQFEKRRLVPGDIIIEKSGGGPKQAVGRVALFDNSDGAYSFSNFTSVARIKNQSEVLPRYLLKFLDWCYISGVTERMQSNTTGIRNLNFGAFKAIVVPLPPLDEQRRIVAVLDEAFAAVATAFANAVKSVANARELLLSYLDSALSDPESGPWNRVPLGDVCEVLDRLRKPITKSDRRPGEYPYYGATGVVDWVDDYIFDEPLVLLGEDGAKWGPGERSAFSASGKYWVNNHAHVMRPNRDVITDDWLIYCLNMADLMPYITGVTVPKLNQERMRSIPVPIPSLETQHELVARMDALSDQVVELTALSNAKLIHLAALKQSLLRRAFSGELTRREPLAA